MFLFFQLYLELGQIDVQSTIETKGRGEGGDDLRNETIQIGVGWTFNVQITTADIIEGLVIDLVRDVGVPENKN